MGSCRYIYNSNILVDFIGWKKGSIENIKMSQRTTCLNGFACGSHLASLGTEDSTEPRSLLAVSQRVSSKDFGFLAAVFFLAGMQSSVA